MIRTNKNTNFSVKCEYLKNSDEIRNKISDLFSTDCRKVAIVAFIGSSATEYIPNFKNLQIYCWPHPGATSANGIRQLQQKGVKVFFSDNMHKKIYWAKGRGTIVASANLTDNGLSGEGLQESAVFIPSDDFDIDTEISNLKEVGLAGYQEIEDLEKRARISESFIPPKKSKTMSFKDFMNLSHTPQIKILSYGDFRTPKSKKEIKENIKLEQKLSAVNLINDNDVDNIANFDIGDIVLQVKTFNDNDEIHKGNKRPLTWLFVDAITYSEEDESYLVAQIKQNREIPFDLDNPEFVAAFKTMFNSLDWEDVRNENYDVKNSFWKKVLDKMNSLKNVSCP